MKSDSETIAQAKEKIAKKLAKVEMKLIKREVQLEIAESLQEDAIHADLIEEIYENFDTWFKNEKEKERVAKRKG
jgi:signal recognition particle GTPase